MQFIETIEDLEALYGTPGESSTVKVTNYLTKGYEDWIKTSKLCILSTVGPEGTDASPRGDNGPVVRIIDQRTLAMPDWRGNNRIDSLRNIVRDARISLMFFIKGSNNVIRVNGRAKLTDDRDLVQSFARKEGRPRCIVLIRIDEVYSQCARALLRSGIWTDKPMAGDLPSVGQLMHEITDGRIDGQSYDEEWPVRAAKTMW